MLSAKTHLSLSLRIRHEAPSPKFARARSECVQFFFSFRAFRQGAEATKEARFEDWWWKGRLAKCYYRLGLYRDAERQLLSSLKDQRMVTTA